MYVFECFELQGVAAGIRDEEGALLAHLTLKPQIGFDDEGGLCGGEFIRLASADSLVAGCPRLFSMRCGYGGVACLRPPLCGSVRRPGGAVLLAPPQRTPSHPPFVTQS